MDPKKIWFNMKQRCYNPKARDYTKYGGRGVKVCDAWLNSFGQFLSDLPSPPDGWCAFTLVDRDKDYEPGNVMWDSRRAKGLGINGAGLTDAEVRDILHLIHEDLVAPRDVALAYPLATRQVTRLALGKTYKIADYPYPKRMPDCRTPEEKEKDRVFAVELYAFTDRNHMSLAALYYKIKKMMYKKRAENLQEVSELDDLGGGLCSFLSSSVEKFPRS